MKSSARKAKSPRLKSVAASMADEMKEAGIGQPVSIVSVNPLWLEFERFLSTTFGTLSETGFEGATSEDGERPKSAEDEIREEAMANIPQLLKAYRRLGTLVRFLAGENVSLNQLALHHLIAQTVLNIDCIHKAKPHRVAVFAADMLRFPVLVSNPPDKVALEVQLGRVEAGSFVSKQDLQSRRKRDACAAAARHFLLEYKVEHDNLNGVFRSSWPSLRKKIGATIYLEEHRGRDWYKELARTIVITGQNRTTGRIESKMKDRILNRIHAMFGLGVK